MATERTLVIVNYFSARLAREAIRTAREASDGRLEVIVVDNSDDDAEWSALQGVEADSVVRAERNLGYAGGINIGAGRARGEVVIAANPDVRFHGDAIERLSRTIDSGYDVAGPAFFWDDEDIWRLPPPDAMSRIEWLDRTLAARGRRWARRRDRRRVRRRVRFWTLEGTRETDVLSGAVLAVRRRTLDRLGGFDERYALYFEEVDFLRRARRMGGRVAYVPEARCRHLYDQSASKDEGSSRKFVESESSFHRRWHGRGFVELMHRFGGPAPVLDTPVEGRFPISLPTDPERALVEVSPQASFDMAVGHFPSSDRISLPGSVLESFAGNSLHVRVLDRSSLSNLGTWVVKL